MRKIRHICYVLTFLGTGARGVTFGGLFFDIKNEESIRKIMLRMMATRKRHMRTNTDNEKDLAGDTPVIIPQKVMMSNVYKYPPDDAGFFANFNFMMSMNTSNRIVIPYWTNKSIGRSPSQTRHYNYWGDSENENIFLKYFDILIDVNIATLPIYSTQGDSRITCVVPRNRLMHNTTEFNAARRHFHTLYSRLFRPKAHIMNKVTEFMADKRDAIAVHVRNPVHNVETRPLKFKDYFDAIAGMDDGVRPILLATDNELSLLVFKDKFGDRLKYFEDSERASVDMHLDWVQALRKGREDATGLINGKGFELHNAKRAKNDIAYDVVFEMLCLQKAAVFIGSVSNVALVAGYINPDLPMTIL